MRFQYQRAPDDLPRGKIARTQWEARLLTWQSRLNRQDDSLKGAQESSILGRPEETVGLQPLFSRDSNDSGLIWTGNGCRASKLSLPLTSAISA